MLQYAVGFDAVGDGSNPTLLQLPCLSSLIRPTELAEWYLNSPAPHPLVDLLQLLVLVQVVVPLLLLLLPLLCFFFFFIFIFLILFSIFLILWIVFIFFFFVHLLILDFLVMVLGVAFLRIVVVAEFYIAVLMVHLLGARIFLIVGLVVIGYLLCVLRH